MRRLILLLPLIALLTSADVDARPRRVVARHRAHRTTVVVHRAFPLRRRLPVVVVRQPRAAVLMAPAVYAAPVVWTAAVVTLPEPDRLVWEDSETLDKDDDWTDFTLNVNDRGTRLFVQIEGKAQLEFAEVVFENGDARVIDFNEKTRGPGIYSLLDFRDGRKVSHVRMVARAKSDDAKIVVRMEK